ncbi:DUF222 domain-containing protein [Spirillospora sp. NPDC047418]
MPSVMLGVQREWEGREWFPPGPQLAICLSGGKERLADLTDDELLQVAAAARRQTSWAQARELVTEEVAAALTVTSNASAALLHLADQLTGPLADTGAALEAGRVDLAKARVISDLTDSLPEQITQRVQAVALEKASTQTTGQLRRRIRRIVQRLAPEAVEERKREAVRQRRLELWDTPAGTSALALWDLAPEDAHAIYNKITAAAHGIKSDGDTRPLQNIRADLAIQLLQGAELPDAIRALLAQTRTAPSAPAAALTAQGAPMSGSAAASPAPSGGVSPVSTSADGGRRASGAEAEVSMLADVIGQRLDHVSGRVPSRELPDAVQRIRHDLAEAGRRRAEGVTRCTVGPATGPRRRCGGRSRPGTRPACFRAATSRPTAATSTTRCRGGPGPHAAATSRPSADATTG